MTMNPNSWSIFTEFEPGFSWIMAVFKKYISSDYLHFMGCLFVAYMVGICFHIKTESRNWILALFFFIILRYYSISFNIMRQTFALSLFCFVFPLSNNKNKIVIYELLVLFLTFYFHRSMIVLTIIPFLNYEYVNRYFCNRKIVYVILLVSYACVFLSSLLYKLIPFLVSSLSLLGSRYTTYLGMSNEAETTVSVLSSFLNTAFCFFITYITTSKQRTNIFFKILIVGTVLSNTLGALSDLFLRISTNLLFFQIVFYTNLWYDVAPKYRKLFRIAVILYCTITYVNAILKNFGLIVPYENQLF